MNRYNNRKWKTKRRYVLERDQFLDRELIRYGKRVEADTVHHIFPVEFYPELKFIDWNLISLHHSTHNEMHDRTSHNLTPKGLELQKRFTRRYRKWCKDNGLEPHWDN